MLLEGTLTPAKAPWTAKATVARRHLGPPGYGNLRGGGGGPGAEPASYPAYLLGHGWLAPAGAREGWLQHSPLVLDVLSEDKFSLFLLMVLGPPAVNCAWLSMQPSFTYWFGQSSFILTAAALLCVATGQAALLRGSLQRRLVCIASVFVPAACLLLTATFTRGAVGSLAGRLSSLDCYNFPAKMHVEEAWRAAAELKRQCVAARAAETPEATEAEVELMIPVKQCPGYEEGLARWESEWTYLEALEGTERCAGWCEPASRPLWRVFLNENPKDRCSLVAADIFGGQVLRVCSQVQLYCVVVLVGGFIFSLA